MAVAEHETKVAAGGSGATAIITPTSAPDRPVESERAAAAPDARAKAMESKPTRIRARSSTLVRSKVQA
jgi:hypothetical protein